ncbi:MAG: hypothetical protein IPM85_06130 [Chitinophagaceae bacterium]|nr:hypothetical protein [Chitinophagaceae bacterium]
MPFIQDILKYQSLAITGLEKNTGKTECLNYIIDRIKDAGNKIAVTSVGLDGEGTDQLTTTHKPDITLHEGMIFITSEKHFRQAKLQAEILDITSRYSATGRLVIAEVKTSGKAILSGPSNTKWLKEIIERMPVYGVHTTLVDGALSRTSTASPAVAEAMILATGAAVSACVDEVVNKTAYAVTLINLPEFESLLNDRLQTLENGVYTIEGGNIFDMQIRSAMMPGNQKDAFLKAKLIYANGAVTNRLLDTLRLQKNTADVILVVQDFTRIFATPQAYNSYMARGGKIQVLRKPRLLAVCINPVSPQGYVLDADLLCEKLQEKINIPVYDIMQMEL